MSSEIDQIKDKIDIVSLVSEYIPLKKAGINHQARCPFHNEKTPSFYVSAERGTYKCFGCGEGGDIFTFTEKMEGLEFRGALEKLAAKAGVTLTNKRPNSSGSSKKELYKSIMEHITLFWQQQLGSAESTKQYLKDRGFTKEIVREYRIGFAPEGWDSAKKYLTSKGFTEQDIEAVGIIKTGEKGTTYDRFRSRIIFPLFDISGSVIAFSGRIFGSDDNAAKYLNSPETPLFNKSKELYGIHTAKQSIRTNNFALLVEGQVDLVMSQQVFPNSVATSGTSLTLNHLKLIHRFTDRIVFVFDSDPAGIESAYRGALLALSVDFEIKVATLEQGKDPADVIIENPETYKEVIAGAIDVFDFYLAHISKNSSGRDQIKAIEEKLFPLLLAVENPLEKDRYVKKISDKLAVTPESIQDRLSQKKQRNNAYQEPESEQDTTQESMINQTSAIKRLAHIILWQESLPQDSRWINTDTVMDQVPENIVQSLNQTKQSIEDINTVSFELENLYKTAIILENDIAEVIKQIEATHSKQTLDTLKQQLIEAEQQGQTEKKEQIKKDIANLLTQ